MKYCRIDYTDRQWFKLMKSFGENLPEEYCDCFDRHGEYSEEYHDIFTTDIYISKENEK